MKKLEVEIISTLNDAKMHQMWIVSWELFRAILGFIFAEEIKEQQS